MMLSQSQLTLPLLAVLDAHGPLRAADAADALAERINLDGSARDAVRTLPCGKTIRTWDRHVRWTEQKARLSGFTTRNERGLWTLGPNAGKRLTAAQPRVLVTLYEADDGVVLWGEVESVEDALQEKSIGIICTSPPYPLQTKKQYDNLTGGEYERWMLERLARWKMLLSDDGSLFLNLGDCWNPGEPTVSIYQERLIVRACEELGFRLAQKLWWWSPSKMPGPAQYVTVERIRVTNAVESVYWLTPTGKPHASNRRVLRPYSDAMKRALKHGGTGAAKRPSGYQMTDRSFSADNGGSIPHNLIIASNTSSNDHYARHVRENGLPAHPARFPSDLPRFCLGLAGERGRVCWDPFGGSLTVAAVARELGMNFIANDRHKEYLEGGLSRLVTAT